MLKKNEKQKPYFITVKHVSPPSLEIKSFECDQIACKYEIIDQKIVLQLKNFQKLRIITKDERIQTHCDKQSDHFKCTLTPAGYPEYAVTQLIYWNE